MTITFKNYLLNGVYKLKINGSKISKKSLKSHIFKDTDLIEFSTFDSSLFPDNYIGDDVIMDDCFKKFTFKEIKENPQLIDDLDFSF